MNIKVDTDYTGNPDDYVREHIATDAEKLVDISRLLTTPATTITVYNLNQHTRETGMLLVLKQTDGHLYGGTEPLDRVWRMIGNTIPADGRSSHEQFSNEIKAINQMYKQQNEMCRCEECKNPKTETTTDSAVRQEFGDLDNPTIIGMTGNTPPGVTVTQRFGNVNGGTIIGYDGSTN